MEGTSDTTYIQNAKLLGESAPRRNSRRNNNDKTPEINVPSLKFFIVAEFCDAAMDFSDNGLAFGQMTHLRA